MEVSVIMPVYNAAPYLDRAIQSALDQPEVVEVIVIDDASTDGSDRLMVKWAEKSSRIRYLPAQSAQPERAAIARNRGLAEATAPYISFLDADDYYLPGRFARTASYFRARAEWQVVAQPVKTTYRADYKGEQQKHAVSSCHFRSAEGTSANFADLTQAGIQMNGLTLRRSVFRQLGYFDPDLSQVQDLDFARRILLSDLPFYIESCSQTPVAVYTHHTSNTSSQLTEKWRCSAHLEALWIRRLWAANRAKKYRHRLFYRYVIFHYRSAPWPRMKKVFLYPFLFSLEALRWFRYLV